MDVGNVSEGAFVTVQLAKIKMMTVICDAIIPMAAPYKLIAKSEIKYKAYSNSNINNNNIIHKLIIQFAVFLLK